MSHVVYDHTSILAFLERKWNLPALTYRDANANDLTDFLDLDALAAGQPTFPELPTLAAPGDTPAGSRARRPAPARFRCRLSRSGSSFARFASAAVRARWWSSCRPTWEP